MRKVVNKLSLQFSALWHVGPVHSLLIFFLVHSKVNVAESVLCRVYTTDGFTNTSCPDVCCSGLVTSYETACCTTLQWNTGVYIGLSVPLFCCIASVLAGIIYCFSVLKPSPSTVNSHTRFRLTNFRSRGAVSPDPRSAVPDVKDDPPSYNELYKKAIASTSSTAPIATVTATVTGSAQPKVTQQDGCEVSVQSPEPPAYVHFNGQTEASTQQIGTEIV